MQDWKEISEFPGYSVNSEGVVRNDRRDSVLARRINQQGIVYVGLVRDGAQYNRGVALIVAEAFLAAPPNEYFNTPIYLDDDRLNITASNLMWRPKWFAMRYHRQFLHKAPPGMRPDVPVEEVATQEQFSDVWFPVMKFGLMWIEVYTAAWNYTRQESPWASVWPTGQQFKLL